MKVNYNLKKYVVVALMAAIMCVLSPISIALPISPVPISLGSFCVYLIVYILRLDGIVSVIIYLLLGAVGVPVFTGFSGGIGKILGPTGGYMIGYIFLALIAGIFLNMSHSKKLFGILGMVLGTIVLYIFGSVWLAEVANMTFSQAMLAGVIPFIPGDIVKMIVASYLGSNIRSRLKKANIL